MLSSWCDGHAEATEGQTSNSYMPAFTRIAPYIAQYGARKYSVRSCAAPSIARMGCVRRRTACC